MASVCENGGSKKPRLVERGVDWLRIATSGYECLRMAPVGGVDVRRPQGADMASPSGCFVSPPSYLIDSREPEKTSQVQNVCEVPI